MSSIQADIEQQLATAEPSVEVLLAEVVGGHTLRLYIDHPDGVDLALCERVTGELRDLLESYSLEVSSPGIDRPLTKPEHFRRYLGRRVKVRTSEAIAGRRNFTGTLTEADDDGVCVDAGGDAVRIPLAGIHRSNLIPEFGGGM